MKYIFLIFSFFTIQSCKGQGEKEIKNKNQIEVLEKSNTICGKNNSSNEDYSKIKNWKLSNEDIINIIQKSEKIDEHILHYAYGNLPCEIIGKVKVAGIIKDFIINAGGYYYLGSEIYGCNSPDCYKYFPKEAEESDAAEDEISTNRSEIVYNIPTEFYGDYSLTVDHGKLDEFSEMSIDYDISIKKNNCTFSGLGYKTYFTDLCTMDKSNDRIIIKYIKQIDGDGMSPHNNNDTLGVLFKKKNKYYIRSEIIADKNWKYNTDILLKKTK
ncbi:DUF5991 domain-containing protein [Chryseobacterium luteum]|uniref:Lipoprotein n=1 Tax=Chryseobacterium luteum TaxID=421531 RepID=A0A085YXN6_9FLAO|nr:DUF5991 domain-containing protein [Chryseobacterium luteum]KFE96949.1 hypothetical protein IX38_22360 [Chryseobacterium luteum]